MAILLAIVLMAWRAWKMPTFFFFVVFFSIGFGFFILFLFFSLLLGA